MYDYIKGTLVELKPEKVVIEAGGIGYLIFIPLSAFTSNSLKLGKEAKLFLSPIYREDSQKLFGFVTPDERETFIRISSISGIGPKTALSLIGHMSLNDFSQAITTSNAKLLSKVPGIGKKTAERVIIEMRDKVVHKTTLPTSTLMADEDRAVCDGVNALVHLGYNNDKAYAVIQKILTSHDTAPKLDTLIKEALQLI